MFFSSKYVQRYTFYCSNVVEMRINFLKRLFFVESCQEAVKKLCEIVKNRIFAPLISNKELEKLILKLYN